MAQLARSLGMLLLTGILFSSCSENQPAAPVSETISIGGLRLNTTDDPQWRYNNLQLFPVIAESGLQADNQGVARLKTLAEGMAMRSFRIMERKQFGRGDEAVINALTTVNKTQDTILMLSGDVVTGGNQDRVIAQSNVVVPGTVQNIPVFCVEKSRWSYYDQNATESDKRIAAFRGYYNMASPTVRTAVHSGNQQGVWSAVAQVTEANKATSSTAAYAGLEQENEQKARRDAYLKFFDGKVDQIPGMTGVVAVCNGKIIGVDIFAHPDLFRREFKSLLHGYATDAAIETGTAEPAGTVAAFAFEQVARLADKSAQPGENAGRFSWNGKWVHLYRK